MSEMYLKNSIHLFLSLYLLISAWKWAFQFGDFLQHCDVYKNFYIYLKKKNQTS